MKIYRSQPINRLVILLFLSLSNLLLSGCMDFASQDPSRKIKLVRYLPGEVYTMRGGAGGIFSTGMNQLQRMLNDTYKIKTTSTVWFKAQTLSGSIIKRNKLKKIHGPIILVGHSLGANGQIDVAKALFIAHVPVALLVTVETVLPAKIPPNVKKVLNIYRSSRVFVPFLNGIRVYAEDPSRTEVLNIDVSTMKNISVNHFTIDKNNEIQTIMLRAILDIINNPHT